MPPAPACAGTLAAFGAAWCLEGAAGRAWVDGCRSARLPGPWALGAEARVRGRARLRVRQRAHLATCVPTCLSMRAGVRTWQRA